MLLLSSGGASMGSSPVPNGADATHQPDPGVVFWAGAMLVDTTTLYPALQASAAKSIPPHESAIVDFGIWVTGGSPV